MEKSKKIICFGAGPAFKGGMKDYNIALAKSLSEQGCDVEIVSWTQQYPSIVPREFKDTISKVDFLKDANILCTYITNYNRPSTWTETADYIISKKADIVIFQWSIAIQGLPIGSIIKKIKSRHSCEVILDLHFVHQKEQSIIDRYLSKKALSRADTYIVHAFKTYEELKHLLPDQEYYFTEIGDRSSDHLKIKTVIKLFHPIYDLYKSDPSFDVVSFKQKYHMAKHVFLFFGFIRKYKGLHNVISAFNELAKKRDDVTLLICGESFWNTLNPQNLVTKFKKVVFGLLKKILVNAEDDERDYNPLGLIKQFGIEDKVVVFNQFIANEDVHKYFQVSDCVVLYYLTATPSGIESLSYNFNLPILATRVGHFPETIEEGINGYIAENNLDSMVKTMERILEVPIPHGNVDKFKSKLSWSTYAKAVMK